MLCWFLSCNHPNQSYIYIYIYLPSLLSFTPTQSPAIPPYQVITEHQTGPPVLCSSFPLAICFIHGSVYMLMLPSQFIPPSLSPSVSTRLFSTSASPFLPCKWVHQHLFFQIPHICVTIQYLFFSLDVIFVSHHGESFGNVIPVVFSTSAPTNKMHSCIVKFRFG